MLSVIRIKLCSVSGLEIVDCFPQNSFTEGHYKSADCSCAYHCIYFHTAIQFRCSYSFIIIQIPKYYVCGLFDNEQQKCKIRKFKIEYIMQFHSMNTCSVVLLVFNHIHFFVGLLSYFGDKPPTCTLTAMVYIICVIC